MSAAKGRTIRIQLHNGEVIVAVVLYVQGDNACVRADDGFVYDVEREANWQGVHIVH